jgi:hypothetical protein
MKKISTFVITVVLLCFAASSFAQQFDAAEYNKHLGKIGTLCDTVKSLKIVNDTLTILNMGGIYPHQKYTILVRGNKISLDWANLKGKAMCVSGVFELYKNKPQIVVAEPDYIQIH